MVNAAHAIQATVGQDGKQEGAVVGGDDPVPQLPPATDLFGQVDRREGDQGGGHADDEGDQGEQRPQAVSNVWPAVWTGRVWVRVMCHLR